MLNFDPQGHDPGRVMILYESPPKEVHTHQFLQFYHKVNDFSAYPLDYRCSTLKMSQLLNTNDRKLLIKVAKFVYFGMKEYTSLPDVVSEEIDNVDLNCLYD